MVSLVRANRPGLGRLRKEAGRLLKEYMDRTLMLRRGVLEIMDA